MALPFADAREWLEEAAEGLGRYRLRTTLSVVGVVLGVAAVIAMMSVSEGAAREALAQVEALGLDNLVARSRAPGLMPAAGGLAAGAAARAAALVPGAVAVSPLVSRVVTLQRGGRTIAVAMLGVEAPFMHILRLTAARGRALSPTDTATQARVCVLGAAAARALFGMRDPIGEAVALGTDHYRVVGVLDARGSHGTSAPLAWRDLDMAAIVPLAALTGRTVEMAGHQPVDEIWMQVGDGRQADTLGPLFARALASAGAGADAFDLVVPRELLAQRYRTQRTFSVVVGSIAALALLIGGIGIMNIMLTSVVERTKEIGVRRTVGATRRHVRAQFLTEALLMTAGGGVAGVLLGAATSLAIAAYAGWQTHVSLLAVVLAFGVSCLIGLTFGLYPAMKAARLEPVEALRYE